MGDYTDYMTSGHPKKKASVKKPKINYTIKMDTIPTEQDKTDRLVEQMMIAFAATQTHRHYEEDADEIEDEAKSFLAACRIFNDVLKEEAAPKRKRHGKNKIQKD